ncbi:MAG: hypothetical protein HKN09_11470 [Saprospiraceae bacterium]|nr:hypothetical protein [Saprospiraceae bacterium]
MIRRLLSLCAAVLTLTFTQTLTSQTLTCNNHLNVTVNDQCSVDITVDMFVEGDSDVDEDIEDGNYTYVIFDLTGAPLISGDINGPTEIAGIILNANLDYEVHYLGNNVCWGTVILEDKTPPEIDCDCPIGGMTGVGDYSDECRLTCWELPLLKENYWDRLRDNLVPEMFDDFIDDFTSDNCDGIIEDDISFYDVYIDLGSCSGTLLRRTWTLEYQNGTGGTSSISCTNEYLFEPIGIETLDTASLDPNTGAIVIPEDSLVLPFPIVELSCGADISPSGVAAFFDNPATVDQDTDDDRLDPDELDIDIVIENNEGIPYAYPHYWVEGRNPSGPHAQAINTEVCNIIVAYTDQEIEACAIDCNGNRKILRNWTILDWCTGEFVQYGQVIKSIDQGVPTIEVNDVTASVDPWKCSANVDLPHPEHIVDDCDSDLTYFIGSVEGALSVSGNASDGYVLHDVPNGATVSVEYYTEDCCGNRGNTFIDVSVSDLTPPVPVTKEYIVLSLTNIANPVDENQGIAKLYAEDVDNGSYDGCTDVELAVRRIGEVCPGEDTTWGDFVKFCCEDLNGSESVEIDVQFRVADDNGNVNYAWSTILLEDKSATTQTCPPDMVLTCDMDYNDFTMTGLPQVFSACGEINLDCDFDELIEDTEPRRKGPNDGNFAGTPYDGVEVAAYDPSCGFGAIRRQFRSCSSCTQWFVIEPIDAFDPNSLTWPEDIVVDCDGFEAGEPGWNPATCNLIGVTLETDTFRFEDGACYKILNYWSVIDWCNYDPSNTSAGGRYDYTQEIKIIDTQDPVLTVVDSLCFASNIDCVSEGVQLSASGNDEGECGSEWLKWEVVIDVNADWTNDYTYGTDLPRLVNGNPNPYYIAPSGNDELITITLPDGLPSSNIWHRAVWRLYDGCGNNVSTVRYFQITDKKAPTPYCLNLSTAVMSQTGEVELWAIDFNVGSFDNCTDNDNLLYTFTEVAPPPRDDSEYDSSSDLEWYDGSFWYYDSETSDYQDQDDYGDKVHRWEPGLRSAGKIFTIDDADASGFAQVPIYVWDENGNTDFCIVNLRLVDNMGVGEGRIAGQIRTEAFDEIEGVMTQLMSDSPDFPLFSMTDENGEYAFNAVAHFSDYEVTGSKNDDYLNGVSTLDLLFIQKHVLGQQSLDSPYKMIAADINNDKDISALDLIELRKLILGVYAELPNNTSWKIIDGAQSLNTLNPWIYSEYLRINDLDTDLNAEDFVGVKVGDVNLSAEVNSKSTLEDNSKNVLSLEFNDQSVASGDQFELLLSSKEAELYGFQFTLEIPGLELIDIKGENITHENIAVYEDKVTISYSAIDGISTDEPLVTFVLKSKTNGQISELIQLGSEIAKAEAYLGSDLEVIDIQLASAEGQSDYALYQNQPNPFQDQTIIGFELPKAMPVTLSFYDVTGRNLNKIEIEGAQGYNEVKVNKADLSVRGMIYYTLESGDFTATKHMIVID